MSLETTKTSFSLSFLFFFFFSVGAQRESDNPSHEGLSETQPSLGLCHRRVVSAWFLYISSLRSKKDGSLFFFFVLIIIYEDRRRGKKKMKGNRARGFILLQTFFFPLFFFFVFMYFSKVFLSSASVSSAFCREGFLCCPGRSLAPLSLSLLAYVNRRLKIRSSLHRNGKRGS